MLDEIRYRQQRARKTHSARKVTNHKPRNDVGVVSENYLTCKAVKIFFEGSPKIYFLLQLTILCDDDKALTF